MGKEWKPVNKRCSKRIKTLMECAGKAHKKKQNTQESEAKYWAVGHKVGLKFERPDGTISVDKTVGWHSRPGHKDKIRQDNRKINKAARRLLKTQLNEEVDEHYGKTNITS